MLALINVVAGIGWEPEIRGALVVLIGSTVLMGSVWMLLATNIGSRVGTLNALAGFFGWIVIMGLVWWIYGGNVLRGDDPSWVPKEGNFGVLDDSVVGDVSDLALATLPGAPDLIGEFCPGLVASTVDLQRARVVESDLGVQLSRFYSAPAGSEFCNDEQIGELLAVDTVTIEEGLRADNAELGPDDPRFLDPAALDERVATTIDDQTRKLGQLTLSGLFTKSPALVQAAETAGAVNLKDWKVVSSADAGEAQARASVFLTSEFNASPYGSATEFIVLDTFQKGGKPKRSGDGVWDRVSNEIRNTVVFWHPVNTTVVQVVATIEKPLVEGQAPPFPEIDPDAQVVSVVMVRDLGSRRLPAALITLGSLVIFLILCWMLHIRDVELRRRVAEWDPAAT